MLDEITTIKNWIRHTFGRLENIPDGEYRIPIRENIYVVTIAADTVASIKQTGESAISDYANSSGWDAYGL